MSKWILGWGAAVTWIGIALIAGGCGNGGSERVTSIKSVPDEPSPAKREQRQRPGDRARTRRPAGQSPREAAAPPRGQAGLSRALADSLRRLPLDKRSRVVGKVARQVLQLLGFQSRVTVLSGGNVVRVAIKPGEACTSTSTTQTRVASRIRQAAPTVKSVQVMVAGTTESLATYVRRHCSGSGLPDGGSGRIVFTRRGSGSVTTPAFTVDSARWTVEYVNRGKALAVLPMKGSNLFPGGFSTFKRTGRRFVRGAGTYRLRITGVDEWVVRVRDGA